jgi:hypothetical protein
LSTHAYAVAFDFDATNNGMYDKTPKLAQFRKEVITPFIKLGGVWGGDWDGDGSSADEPRCDGMHFQWVRVK